MYSSEYKRLIIEFLLLSLYTFLKPGIITEVSLIASRRESDFGCAEDDIDFKFCLLPIAD